ncbi:MAG: phosphoribosylformylglycinamidine synthase subunit PurQ [Pseudomonadota bacterium]|nr:phosphoribosylformylglycinamidine synthase subunit PurQ [Pseudomonadota bacterium]
MKKCGVLRFPGTNCDFDTWKAVEKSGGKPEWLWHADHFNAKEFEAFLVPGGFSYGDYLRSGALAARSPAMDSLREANHLGRPILGICNGFQILCEAGLLEGALIKNAGLRFVDSWSEIKLVNPSSFWAANIKKDERINLPIAHGDGRYYAEKDTIKKMQDREQIWWQYVVNPNGSLNDIAGIKNEKGNVGALMPHPERALFAWMGADFGKNFFTALGH